MVVDEAASEKQGLDEIGEAGGEAGVGAGVEVMPAEASGAEVALEGGKLRLKGGGDRRLEGEEDDGLAAAAEGTQKGQALGGEARVEGAGGGNEQKRREHEPLGVKEERRKRYSMETGSGGSGRGRDGGLVDTDTGVLRLTIVG